MNLLRKSLYPLSLIYDIVTRMRNAAYDAQWLKQKQCKVPKGMKVDAFLEFVKDQLGTPVLRHSKIGVKTIERVAVLGGSGSFAIQAAKKKKADAYITADLKYHDFFEGNNDFLLIDAGHYETEQHTKKLIHDYLTEKMPNFAILLSALDTNPINYM